MSAYTSLKISRRTVGALIAKAMSNDEDLRDMVNVLLEKHTLYNCYRITDGSEENEDERLHSILGLGYVE